MNREPSSKCAWLFGRGCSVACNLRWAVRDDLKALPREAQITRITEILRTKMESVEVSGEPYRTLLAKLASDTLDGWHHFFLTTNWDYLLQREIQKLGLTVAPRWLPETHVYHLNGSVEPLDSPNRSSFLLETDPEGQRVTRIEANVGFTHLIWQRCIVIVGMSFACPTDMGLLAAIERVAEDLPIGEANWIVINRDSAAVTAVVDRLRGKFPRAIVQAAPLGFTEWQEQGMRELQELRVLR